MARPKVEFVPWDNWQIDIIDLYREGGSDVEVRALILDSIERSTFSFDLWDRWLDEEEEFSETIKMGRMLSEAWWTKQGREGLWISGDQMAEKLNYTGWYMNMKNRWGWADKKEIKSDLTSNGESLNIPVVICDPFDDEEEN